MRQLYRTDYLNKDDPRHITVRDFVRDKLHYMDYQETVDWYKNVVPAFDKECLAFLGANDRYFLVTIVLNRTDLFHPWLFDRCREVEESPDGHLDLWARFHAKSSLITLAGSIQEIIRNPEITIAIFSVTKPIAQEFLGQIKMEFESNDQLKRIYDKIFYQNPRMKGDDGRPTKWSLQRGITIKRQGKPKEATIEAHGLIDGQPTGRHFHLHIYDDVVTQDNLSEELLKKTTERFEMADNLGTRHGVRKWIVGTPYHFGDTYSVIRDRGSAKPRLYPATEDGTLSGPLVLLSPDNWDRIKRDQGLKTVNAQMLLNPLAGNEATFSSLWLKTYDIVPRILNVYILVDPSKGSGQRSDRTAIPVIGIDPNGNKYLLDGVCHRMKLTERLAYVEQFKAYWENVPGVQHLKVGWERYGMQVDLEVVEDLLRAKDNFFTIEELNTPKQGGHSKPDRIERLEPDIRGGRFFLPCVAYHFDFGPKSGPFAGNCYWSVWSPEADKQARDNGEVPKYNIGQIIYRPMKGLTRTQLEYQEGQNKLRIVRPLRRKDESREIYDMTRIFIEEMVRHPYAPHDDLLDACSRIYDIEPEPPQLFEVRSTEGIDVDDTGLDNTAVPEDEAFDA